MLQTPFSRYKTPLAAVFPQLRPNRQVIGWYEATDANVRRGTSTEGRSLEYVVDADDIVQAVPLQYVTKQEDLDKQLQYNKVVLVEMKEVPSVELEAGYEETTLQL